VRSKTYELGSLLDFDRDIMQMYQRTENETLVLSSLTIVKTKKITTGCGRDVVSRPITAQNQFTTGSATEADM